ncbi:hypothetical protein MRX96_054875 [Rhipicephalus microplus]
MAGYAETQPATREGKKSPGCAHAACIGVSSPPHATSPGCEGHPLLFFFDVASNSTADHLPAHTSVQEGRRNTYTAGTSSATGCFYAFQRANRGSFPLRPPPNTAAPAFTVSFFFFMCPCQLALCTRQTIRRRRLAQMASIEHGRNAGRLLSKVRYNFPRQRKWSRGRPIEASVCFCKASSRRGVASHSGRFLSTRPAVPPAAGVVP